MNTRTREEMEAHDAAARVEMVRDEETKIDLALGGEAVNLGAALGVVGTGDYRKFEHLERLGNQEVFGLEFGTVHVFPKVDGTNASVWHDGFKMRAGSRTRELGHDKDNAGFFEWVTLSDAAQLLREVAKAHPTWIIYGEWLVPHTIKTYREEAWKRLWIFDVYDRAAEAYVPFETYAIALEGLDVVRPLCTIKDPTSAQLIAQAEANTFLMQDGAGPGEGVVFKNYGWRNRHGRQTWAKYVRNEFKESNSKVFGVTAKEGTEIVEALIVRQFVTPTLVGKTKAKVLLEVANLLGVDLTEPNAALTLEQGQRGKLIPMLLGRVFHDLCTEELWSALKKHKNPTIDFRRLNAYTVGQVKELLPELFS